MSFAPVLAAQQLCQLTLERATSLFFPMSNCASFVCYPFAHSTSSRPPTQRHSRLSREGPPLLWTTLPAHCIGAEQIIAARLLSLSRLTDLGAMSYHALAHSNLRSTAVPHSDLPAAVERADVAVRIDCTILPWRDSARNSHLVMHFEYLLAPSSPRCKSSAAFLAGKQRCSADRRPSLPCRPRTEPCTVSNS